MTHTETSSSASSASSATSFAVLSLPDAQSVADLPAVERGWLVGSRLAQRLARRLLLAKLEHLRHGRLELIDAAAGERRHVFGQPVTVADDLRATVRVLDRRFYPKVVFGGSIGAAEAYMAGWWSADDLTMALRLFARNLAALDALDSGAGRFLAPVHRLVQFLRANTRRGSRRNIGAHYDLSNDFFELFLDPTMSYSSAVFEREDMTLEEASVAKMDRLARLLDLRPSDHLLEIGTGWGGFAVHAAERYGCRVTTTTISRRQHRYATERVKAAGLEDRVEVLLEDYRDLPTRLRGSGGAPAKMFDKLVSIEMIEAVGHRYLDTYFRTCSELLAPHGSMALQAIVMADRRFERYRQEVDFIQRYVFPGSALPSVGSITSSVARVTDFQVSYLDDIGSHYARTLAAWRDRFFARIGEVRGLGFSRRFVRLWDYYLSYCEAGFREGSVGDVQMLLSKPRAPAGGVAPHLAQRGGSFVTPRLEQEPLERGERQA